MVKEKVDKNPPRCGTCHTFLVVKHNDKGVAQSVYCERCQKYLYKVEDWIRGVDGNSNDNV
jgi:uncharacterized paraquat-inducible protein A